MIILIQLERESRGKKIDCFFFQSHAVQFDPELGKETLGPKWEHIAIAAEVPRTQHLTLFRPYFTFGANGKKKF